jgi:hypothetical protein
MNVDIHLFQTRDGKWKARVERKTEPDWESEQRFTKEHHDRWGVYQDVEKMLTNGPAEPSNR